jgi:hypothetical protein
VQLTALGKGKVESGIGHTQKTLLKGLRFESLEEAQAYLDSWEQRWANTRIHGTTKRRVAGVGNSSGKSCRPAPLRSIPKMPSNTRWLSARGRPPRGCLGTFGSKGRICS